MNITAREGAYDLPAYSSDTITQLEVRDDEGHLVLFVRFLRDRMSILVAKRGEDDFEWNAKNHKIPLHVPVTESQPASRGIILG